MEAATISFDDGAAYESFMGVWSRLAGDVFIDWLTPAAGLRWADVGCGNGAFTELLLQRCAPAEVQGIDPSEQQLAFARHRFASGAPVAVQAGDARALPWPDDAFDAAVMALVIFFVPDPAKGVAEMARVVKPGGSVSAYAWDIRGGGFPFDAMQEALRGMGIEPLWPPSTDASRLDVLRELWTGAGLVDLRTRAVTVERRFDDFETFWRIARSGPRLAPRLSAMSPDESAELKERVRQRLGADASGGVVCSASANAIEGRVGR